MRILLATVVVVALGCGPQDLELQADELGSFGSALGEVVFLNEVLANEPGSAASGEFVELVNGTSSAVDLGGWTISDSYRVRHVFPNGTVLSPRQALVLTGAQASTGTFALNNGGDIVTLRDATGATRDQVSYPASLGAVDGVSMNRARDGDSQSGFVLHSQLSALKASPGAKSDGSAFGGVFELRVVAANVTSGNMQSYTPGEGMRILQALAPDVTLIQEFNYGGNTPEELRGFVDSTFGSSFFYVRESGKQIPNGVVSRWPIIATGTWDDPYTTTPTRDFVWARIDVPGPKDLWAVSLHLLTANSTTRNAEAVELAAQLRAFVPESDYLVVGGDLNTGWRGEAALTTLSTLVKTEGPHPVDQQGNEHTNATRSKPYDWVLADAELSAKQVPTALGAQSFPNGLVFDSRVFSPVSDAAPVLYWDSGAVNMQHMAVVKDYLVEE